ncbi:TonB-dependent receptor [Corallincola spongiicola]|uniref:TonB-dependent receptor n=1 Tax=Corallincola spongiicola TaxID=2520508 RepID=A0ABY1WT39_9GAMM|nr:TonB-dependent receptor [Corallincola spongiicola]TAA47692.1 TonB-dependent receptor [Corallincola spongiicola]
MYTSSKLAKAVRLAMIGGAFASAATAVPAYAADEEEVERIEVTGSRIKRTDLENASPVSVITADDIMKQGVTNVSDVLQQMSASAGSGLTPAINNGGGGKASVDLRGLGTERTLVLVNGRRMVNSGTGADASVDLNTIPIAMVKRIEVLKDGASAVYGSDAIAGVVNVILKDDFEGAEISAQHGATTKGDGEEYDLSLTLGGANDKGNFVMNLGYYKRKAVGQANRGFSDCPIAEEDESSPDNAKFCAGSWYSIGGHGYLGNPNDPDFFENVQFEPGGNPANATGGQYHDWVNSGDNTDRYNYAAASYLSTPAERYTINTISEYEIAEDIRVFGEGMYTKRESDQQMAPQPIGAWFIPAYDSEGNLNPANDIVDENGNPLDVTLWRRMADVGPRKFRQDISTFRVVGGFEGDFDWADRSFSWQTYYQYGRNDATDISANYVNMYRVEQSSNPDVCSGSTADAGFDPASDVPCINYTGADALSSADADYIRYTDQATGFNEQNVWGASIGGDAFELPAGTLGFSFGFEHRDEEGGNQPDALTVSGQGAGNATQPTRGGYTVDEVYLETIIPLLSDMTAVKQLDLEAAVRYSDYNTYGDDTNYKLGLTWQVMDGLMFRSVKSTSFRAPSVDELYSGQSDSYLDHNDPCSDYTSLDPSSVIYQNCLAHLGGNDFTQQNDQTRAIVGGNQELEAETADTLTLGVVYESEFLEGFSATVDYYDIEIDDAISTRGVNDVINDCYSTAGAILGEGNCANVGRDQTGALDGVAVINENLQKIETKGYDIAMRYQTQVSNLDLGFTWEGTYVDEYVIDGNHDEGQIFANAGGIPEFKWTLGTDLSGDDWSLNWQMRFIKGMKDETIDEATPDPVSGLTGWEHALGKETDDIFYHDVAGTYFVTDSITLIAGIDNLLDEEPEYYTNYNDANTDPYTYDVLGRRYYIRAVAKF